MKLKKAVSFLMLLAIISQMTSNTSMAIPLERANNLEIKYINDDNGIYPESNDGNVDNQNISVVNPSSDMTTPSLVDSTDAISKEKTLEYNEAWVTKYAKSTDENGKFEINLRAEGHEKNEKIDVVIVLDNSNSMSRYADETLGYGATRAQEAKRATENFIDSFKDMDNVGLSLVTYGTTLFDGKTEFKCMDNSTNIIYGYGPASYNQPLNYYYYGKDQYFLKNTNSGNYCVDTFQYSNIDKENMKNKIPNNVPSDRGLAHYGGTFTQQALIEADRIAQTSTAEKKFIVLISDGVPTYAYKGKTVTDRPERIIDYSNSEQLYDSKVITSFDYNDYPIGTGRRFHLGKKIFPINITPVWNSHYEVYRYYLNTQGDYGMFSVNFIPGTYPSSYTLNYDNAIADKQYDTDDGYTVVDLGLPTISEAIWIRDNSENLEILSLGIGMQGGYISSHDLVMSDQTTKLEESNLMRNISGSVKNYYSAKEAIYMQDELKKIATRIKHSIPNGKIIDPIGDQFNLDINTGSEPIFRYPWTEESDPAYSNYDVDITVSKKTLDKQNKLDIEDRIKARYEIIDGKPQITTDKITFVGQDEWVHFKYNVRIRTEDLNPKFNTDTLYQTNGRTYLIPDVDSTIKRELDFYVPSARAKGSNILLRKIWELAPGNEPIPIEVELIRKYQDPTMTNETSVETVTVDENSNWEYKFSNLINFDNRGNNFIYEIREKTIGNWKWEALAKPELEEIDGIPMEVIELFNKQDIPNLPNTGGPGAYLYYVIGIPIVLIALKLKYKT